MQGAEPRADTGLLAFAVADQNYCVRLMLRDLRSGDEASSEVVCATPQPESTLKTDSDLTFCDGPPNAALTERWCLLHPAGAASPAAGGAAAIAADPPACAPFRGTGGSGGSSATDGSGGGSGTAINDGGPVRGGAASAGATSRPIEALPPPGPHTSSSCAFNAKARGAAPLVALFGFAFVLARRRARSRVAIRVQGR